MHEDLLNILACPACPDRPAVAWNEDKTMLVCARCARKYSVENGVPIMLVEGA